MRDRLRLKPAQLKKLIQIAGDRRRRRDTRLWAMTQLVEGGYEGPSCLKTVTAIGPGPDLVVAVR